MLSYIRAMQIIMIFDAPFVFIVNLDNKLQKFVVVDDLQQIIQF